MKPDIFYSKNKTFPIWYFPGNYCDVPGVIEPTGPCSPGWYCLEGSTVAESNICPAGHNCPEGTHTPARCPAGTFSNATSLAAATECTNCTAGWYCQQTGLTLPEAVCQQGYYCPEGWLKSAIT